MSSHSPTVEEKLSVTTAIIGLLAVGGKTIDTLWDLTTPADKKSTTTVYVQALQEIKQCRSTIHVLYKTLSLLELAQLPYPERGTWIRIDHVIAILTDTVLAMSELQASCETLSLEKLGFSTSSSSPPPPQRQRQQQQQQQQQQPHPLQSQSQSPSKDNVVELDCASPRQKNIEGLCSRIRWHNLSMTMMMTILKCPGESDAQNSRVGLERRMKRLLSANTNLSARMRQLDDFFAYDRLGREPIPLPHPHPHPHYGLLARHPHFWLLPRLTPYPGTAAAAAAGEPSTDSFRANDVNETNACPKPLLPLSSYTLADIPILSVIPLPVATSELTDGAFFYTFAYARRVSHDLGELMQHQAGQGTSRSLGAILGRTNTGTENGASSTSTDCSSSDGGAVVVRTEKRSDSSDGQTKANKWKVRNFKVRRRWRV
ncbi:hypothetical protein E4U21_004261 [Claviceps maximensis]|nr:hypothetical protein E4U21_004261 [Claviceps maximensis]